MDVLAVADPAHHCHLITGVSGMKCGKCSATGWFVTGIILRTEKDRKGKYGRYLGTLFIDGIPKSINEWLIEKGFASPY